MNNFYTSESEESVVVDLSSLKPFGPPPQGNSWNLIS